MRAARAARRSSPPRRFRSQPERHALGARQRTRATRDASGIIDASRRAAAARLARPINHPPRAHHG
ncbi:hypothetical protein F5D26_06185 [Burkholderia pseudomallei]|nr:hypothetical protein F5D26_06185 [Burkholderia pseudomallei]